MVSQVGQRGHFSYFQNAHRLFLVGPFRQPETSEEGAGKLSEISGRFLKITSANDPDIQLRRGLPDRPAARIDRIGQDNL